MTNEEIALKHAMTGYLKENLTHGILVSKSMPGSPMPELVKQAAVSHRELVDKLMNDGTKTSDAKMLYASKSAEKSIMVLLKKLDGEKGNAASLKAHLKNKIAEILTPKEPAPLDALTRQTTFANIKDLSFGDVLSLIRQGDAETAKCLSLPLAVKQFKVDAKRAERLMAASEQALLTTVEYQSLELARRGDSAYEQMGTALADQAGNCIETQRRIGELVVEAA